MSKPRRTRIGRPLGAMSFIHILLISGNININFTRKNANMPRPSQVLKFIAMTSPKKAPTKCSAK